MKKIFMVLQSHLDRGIFQEPQAEDLVTDEMIRQFSARYADTLESVSLMESVGSGKAQLGDKTVNVDIKGVNADYAKAEDKELLYGRFITPRDIEGKKYLAVVSESLASELFPEPLSSLLISTEDQDLEPISLESTNSSRYACSSALVT